MSQTQTPTYKIIRGDDTKTFDSEDKWLDVQALLDDQDVDYTTEIDGEPQHTDGGTVNGDLDQDVQIVDHGPESQRDETESNDSDDATDTDGSGASDDVTPGVDECVHCGADLDGEGWCPDCDGGQEDAHHPANPQDATDAMDTDQPQDAMDEPDVVDKPEDVPDDPPERNLSDDPVEWFDSVGEFTYTKNGAKSINKKGLRVLQYWYDIEITDAEVIVGPEETDQQFCRVRAEAQMPDGRKAVAHGSAHVERGDDSYLLVEMADTRAKSRVLLDITGMGGIAVSELENEP